jgi:hypothetical protein
MIIADRDTKHTCYSIEKWLCFWLVKVNGWPYLHVSKARAVMTMQRLMMRGK